MTILLEVNRLAKGASVRRRHVSCGPETTDGGAVVCIYENYAKARASAQRYVIATHAAPNSAQVLATGKAGGFVAVAIGVNEKPYRGSNGQIDALHAPSARGRAAD
jgi:hypothetical protein